VILTFDKKQAIVIALVISSVLLLSMWLVIPDVFFALLASKLIFIPIFLLLVALVVGGTELARSHKRERMVLTFNEIQKLVGGEIESKKPSFWSGEKILNLSGKHRGISFSIEYSEVYGESIARLLKLSTHSNWQFSINVSRYGLVPQVAEKLSGPLNFRKTNWRDGEFWIESNQASLAKEFVEKNRTELLALLDGFQGPLRIESGELTAYIKEKFKEDPKKIIQFLDGTVDITKKEKG
jgi:hypothetical protein